MLCCFFRYVNYVLYWVIMFLNLNSEERKFFGRVVQFIEDFFGSYFNFQLMFEKIVLEVFGLGYVWFCLDIE